MEDANSSMAFWSKLVLGWLGFNFISSIKILEKYNLKTSPSGGAGFAGLVYCLKNELLEIKKLWI